MKDGGKFFIIGIESEAAAPFVNGLSYWTPARILGVFVVFFWGTSGEDWCPFDELLVIRFSVLRI